MIEKCFIIGNGESRLQFDLNKLNGKGITYGCNGLHRDYKADIFSACDIRLAKEIIEHGYQVYTRKYWNNMFNGVKNVKPFNEDNPQIKYFPELPYKGNKREDEPFQWGTGPYAALLAAMSGSKDLYFLGFDLYGLDNHSKHNNVYKDTVNYESKNYRAVGPEYWIHQLGKIFQIYNSTSFTFVLNDDWKRCPEWKDYPLKYINYKTFEKGLTKF